jgi:predicted nucleic acid-binding Zn ribbon protein
MALLLRGKTDCAVCGKVINEDDEATLFPHIIANEQDALFALSDSACHRECAQSDLRGQNMIAAFEESLLRSGPGHRECAVCGEQVLDPDDYFLIGRLTGDTSAPLFKFNYTHLHKSHVAEWDQAAAFLAAAKTHIDTGLWSGEALQGIMESVNLQSPDTAR